jgi:hypothetical protein
MTKKVDKKYNPEPNYPFFLYDPEGNGFEYYKTEKERDELAKDTIQGYLVDGWDEQVTNVITGKVTGQATMVDVETQDGELDEECCDEKGVYWDDGYDYRCDYQIKPLGYSCSSTEKLKN